MVESQTFFLSDRQQISIRFPATLLSWLYCQRYVEGYLRSISKTISK